MRFTILALGIALVLSATSSAQYKLEYKSTGGEALHYTAHATLSISQTMMGQEAKSQIVSDQSMTVSGTKSGDELVFDITVDTSRNLTVMPSGDTTLAPAPTQGKTREARVHPDGEEISSKWLDTTFANSQAAQTKDWGNFFFKLPDEVVSVGSTWNHKKVDTVMTPGGHGQILVNTDTDYKLSGEESVDGITCARIEYTGKVTLKGSATMQGVDLAIDGGGTVSGTAFFDYNSGKVLKLNGKSNQDLVMATAGDNPMTIPMSQKTNYDLSLAR